MDKSIEYPKGMKQALTEAMDYLLDEWSGMPVSEHTKRFNGWNVTLCKPKQIGDPLVVWAEDWKKTRYYITVTRKDPRYYGRTK